jgi:hypothetical protein
VLKEKVRNEDEHGRRRRRMEISAFSYRKPNELNYAISKLMGKIQKTSRYLLSIQTR